jgi:hypothetical protein
MYQKVLDCGTLTTHSTGHFLALPYTAGLRASTGGTERTMRQRDTVRSRQTAKTPPFHNTLKTFSFAAHRSDREGESEKGNQKK